MPEGKIPVSDFSRISIPGIGLRLSCRHKTNAVRNKFAAIRNIGYLKISAAFTITDITIELKNQLAIFLRNPVFIAQHKLRKIDNRLIVVRENLIIFSIENKFIAI